MEGDRELCEMTLAEEPPSDFEKRLNQALPAGIQVTSLVTYAARRPAAARVVGGLYEVVVEATGPGGPVAEAAARLAAAPSLPIEDRRGDRVRILDVKAYVDEVQVETLAAGTYTLRFRVRTTPQGSVRVERVVEALISLGAPSLTVRSSRRTHLELR
jgi:hypothetical protein